MPTKEYMREYRQKRKELALNMLGGKCVKCGSDEDLQSARQPIAAMRYSRYRMELLVFIKSEICVCLQ